MHMQERGVAKFKGALGYKANTWNQDTMADYTTKINAMEMLDNETARVAWEWRGQLGPFDAAADVVSALKLNVLTGKIVEHTDEVAMRANPVARVLYSAQKGLWGKRQGAKAFGNKARASACAVAVVLEVVLKLLGQAAARKGAWHHDARLHALVALRLAACRVTQERKGSRARVMLFKSTTSTLRLQVWHNVPCRTWSPLLQLHVAPMPFVSTLQVNETLDKFSMDKADDSTYTPDPLDANKFFQHNDNRFQDGVSFAIFVTILWTLWQAYSNLEGF
jgi:hypothetical protein